MGLKEKIREMDFNWLAQGNHKISLEAFMEKWANNEAIILDVRTEEEAKLSPLSAFGIHIPLNQIPDRLSEIPKDKLVCIICNANIRASIAYAFLIDEGFDNVKVLASNPSELVGFLKPGKIKKLLKRS